LRELRASWRWRFARISGRFACTSTHRL